MPFVVPEKDETAGDYLARFNKGKTPGEQIDEELAGKLITMKKNGLPDGAIEQKYIIEKRGGLTPAAKTPAAPAAPAAPPPMLARTPPAAPAASGTIVYTPAQMRIKGLRLGDTVEIVNGNVVNNYKEGAIPASTDTKNLYKIENNPAGGFRAVKSGKTTMVRGAKASETPAVGDHVTVDQQSAKIHSLHKNCAAGCAHTHKISAVFANGKFQVSTISNKVLTSKTKITANAIAASNQTVLARKKQKEAVEKALAQSQGLLGVTATADRVMDAAVDPIKVGDIGKIENGYFIKDLAGEFKVIALQSGDKLWCRKTDNTGNRIEAKKPLNKTTSTAATPATKAKDDDLVNAAKAIVDVMVEIEPLGDNYSSLATFSELTEQLADLFEGCAPDKKLEIYNYFKTKISAITTPTKELTTFIHGLVIYNTLTRANQGEIIEKFRKVDKLLVNVNAQTPQHTMLTGKEIEFTYTAPAPVTAAKHKSIIEILKDDAVTPPPLVDPPAPIAPVTPVATDTRVANRWMVESSKSGKGKPGKVADAIGPRGFNMEKICDGLEKSLTHAKKEATPAHTYRTTQPSKRLDATKAMTTADERDADDKQKHKLFGEIVKVEKSPGANAEKDSTLKLYAKGDAAGAPILTAQRADLPAAAGATKEALRIVIDTADLDHKAFADKDFAISDAETSRKAGLAAALPKTVRKAADAIGAKRARVYLQDDAGTGVRQAVDYSDPDLKSLILTATAAFSANLFPVLEPADIKTRLTNYITREMLHVDKDLRQVFSALQAGLAKPDPDEAVEEFRAKYTSGTKYEAAGQRPINSRS